MVLKGDTERNTLTTQSQGRGRIGERYPTNNKKKVTQDKQSYSNTLMNPSQSLFSGDATQTQEVYEAAGERKERWKE